LDPWRAGNCPVCFGWCARIASKIQFACISVLSSFGSLACKNLSCLLWVICEVCFDIAFKESFVSPSDLLVGGAKYYKVPRQVKLAEREDVVWQAGKT
jgi:hypothetical protein